MLHPNDIEITEKDLEIITLNNVLISGQYNDLAFKVKGKMIVLMEHQSTINPNMPYRMLLYLAEEYTRSMEDRSKLYSSKKIILQEEFNLEDYIRVRIKDGLEDAIEEVREKIRKEGREEGIRIVEINLLEDFSDEKIAEKTRLTVEKIRELRIKTSK